MHREIERFSLIQQIILIASNTPVRMVFLLVSKLQAMSANVSDDQFYNSKIVTVRNIKLKQTES